jgi:uncharacterized LabA/DUF88 family protein
MQFYPKERLAILIDGVSFYTAARQLRFEIDFRRLLAFLRSRGRLVHTLYYALADDEESGFLTQLSDWLAYNGFNVVAKPRRVFTDALGQRRTSGNIRVELAVDALRLVDDIDHVVLFTGDGDFRALVAAIQMRGRRVSIASTLRMTAGELRRQADQFIELADLEEQIGREPDKRSSQEPDVESSRQVAASEDHGPR